MILSTLIRALIEDKTVAISGFGIFSVKHISSQIKDDIIYPPHNIIEFSFNRETEDFSFVSKLSQWEQIRIDEAHAKISEWICLIEKGLEHNKSVFFDDLGTFSKNSNNIIVFQGMINNQLNIENEGFEPIVLPKKNKNNIKEPVKDKRIILQKRKKRREAVLFFVLIFAAITLLFFLFLKEQFNNFYQTVAMNIKTIIQSDSIEEEHAIFISKIAEENPVIIGHFETNDKTDNHDLHSVDIKEFDTENSANNLISLTEYKELYLPYKNGNYYIIAGSFMKEESALLHIKQKKLEKFHAKLIIHPENPRIRVCIGIFDNEEEALKIATQLDKNYWVLK